MENRTYLCIDLKSFYASVECVLRGLDPMTAKLVVADPERSDKTICLAITPAMKALGIHNRCRVFEIPKNVEYIMAPPRMQKYIDYAAEIYGIYLKYIFKDDIHVYSIDEAFIDVTHYLGTYKTTAKELAVMLMSEVFKETGIRATCGIGTNLYLAKIALDITAKRSPDFIGTLNEETYRSTLWDHRPLTDFWRIGKGTAERLAKYGIMTIRQIADANEDLLYKLFGIDAELLIDHAWGREPVTIADIKAYKPKTNCLTSGQVLMRDYTFEEGRLIVTEMMDLLCLDMADKGLVTGSITIYVGYSNALKAEPAGGTVSLGRETSADSIIIPAAVKLYERIVDPVKPVRRVNITCNNVIEERGQPCEQLSLFDTDNDNENLEKNKRAQKAVLGIKK
jgi:DNA polymerase V